MLLRNLSKLSLPWILLLSQPFLFACGTFLPKEARSPQLPPVYHDARLSEIMTAYIQDAAQAGVPVSSQNLQELRRIEWVDSIGKSADGSEILGRCTRYHEGASQAELRYRTVSIVRPRPSGTSWSGDSITLKTIVYHELGHCLHDIYGHPVSDEDSLMNASLPSARYDSFERLIDEHFSFLKFHGNLRS